MAKDGEIGWGLAYDRVLLISIIEAANQKVDWNKVKKLLGEKCTGKTWDAKNDTNLLKQRLEKIKAATGKDSVNMSNISKKAEVTHENGDTVTKEEIMSDNESVAPVEEGDGEAETPAGPAKKQDTPAEETDHGSDVDLNNLPKAISDKAKTRTGSGKKSKKGGKGKKKEMAEEDSDSDDITPVVPPRPIKRKRTTPGGPGKKAEKQEAKSKDVVEESDAEKEGKDGGEKEGEDSGARSGPERIWTAADIADHEVDTPNPEWSDAVKADFIQELKEWEAKDRNMQGMQ